MTSSHAGTPQARAKIHTTLTDFEIALQNWSDQFMWRTILAAKASACSWVTSPRATARSRS